MIFHPEEVADVVVDRQIREVLVKRPALTRA